MFRLVLIFQYCVWEPKIYTLDEYSCKQTLLEKKIAQIIHKNILHHYPDSMDISIINKYNYSARKEDTFVVLE